MYLFFSFSRLHLIFPLTFNAIRLRFLLLPRPLSLLFPPPFPHSHIYTLHSYAPSVTFCFTGICISANIWPSKPITASFFLLLFPFSHSFIPLSPASPSPPPPPPQPPFPSSCPISTLAVGPSSRVMTAPCRGFAPPRMK